MKLFDVYPLMDVTPVKAQDCSVWDKEGNEYLDLYGGHAVISIGHTHSHYIEKLSKQLNNIGFYSNSVQNPLQIELAEKLRMASGLEDYSLFLCNSGAEANENALKLASFHNGKGRILAFEKAFHGRTSLAVAATDNPNIRAKVNQSHDVTFVPLNDISAVNAELEKGDVCAVIIEGVQGIAGIKVPTDKFLQELEQSCKKYDTVLILDEIQSGYGRTGEFFAFQTSGIQADLITMAKGMGNGFPIGGVLISSKFEAKHGLLGTTFGGNHLAAAAAIAVLDVIQSEKLIENAKEVGNYFIEQLRGVEGIKGLRGKGLMIAIEFEEAVAPIRKRLIEEKRIFTGISSTNVIRLLPPLTITKAMVNQFVEALKSVLNTNGK